MTNKESPLSTSELTLLALLLRGPSHGYDLHKHISDSNGVGMIWNVKISNLYAQLEKLALRGFIQGNIQASESQRPARTEYRLTVKGEEAVRRWLREPAIHPSGFRHEFLLRIYFISEYQPNDLEPLIDQQINICQSWLENVFGSDVPPKLSGSFADLTRNFRYSQIQSMVEWLIWLKTQIPIIHTQRGEK